MKGPFMVHWHALVFLLHSNDRAALDTVTAATLAKLFYTILVNRAQTGPHDNHIYFAPYLNLLVPEFLTPNICKLFVFIN